MNRLNPHYTDSELSITTLSREILRLCECGQIAEARGLLIDSDDPLMLLARGVVYHCLARSGREFTHEQAKDLLTKAERLGAPQGLCQVYLGLCYWRQDEISEALTMLAHAEQSDDPHVRFLAALGRLQLQLGKGYWREGLRTIGQLDSLVDSESIASKAKFFHHRGWAYRLAHGDTGQDEYLDRALVDYEAAREFYEQAGHAGHEASVLNNLAFAFLSRDTEEAHINVDLAASIYSRLNDKAGLGSAKDTKAQIYLKEGNLKLALKYADESIRLLTSADDTTWLSNSYLTKGKILAATGDVKEAIESFKLTNTDNVPGVISALKDLADVEDLIYFYRLLPETPDTRCALTIIERALVTDSKNRNRKQEKQAIADALRQHNGRVTPAAKMLGKSHSTLNYLINEKYPELKPLRRKSWKRRKSVIYLRDRQ